MKRAGTAFDRSYFAKKKMEGMRFSNEDIFTEIFETNHWAAGGSVSGQGSEQKQTEEISLRLSELISQMQIRTFLDIPCGDFNWFGRLEKPPKKYIGGDIVQKIVDANNEKFGRNDRIFLRIDLMQDPLPAADILLCRDCLVHLSNSNVQQALSNIKRSSINYLLTTTFSDCQQNEDIVTGDWRIINLEKAPFNLPKPALLINEKCTEGNGTYADKCLGLWKIADLP